MKLSIVTSLYQSELYIRPFYERMRAVASRITSNFEIIFVNDGSTDKSLDIVCDIKAGDKQVVVIDLSRNFGHHQALMAGLRYSTGDLVFMIDVDLEEEPELLTVFFDRYLETRADSIYGVQDRRKGGLFERLSGALFYRVLTALSGTNTPTNTLVARLMTRRFVDSLLLHHEREIDIAGLLHITGYAQVPISVIKHSKPETTYTISRKIKLALVSLTAFSRSPLIAIAAFGGVILIVTTSIIIFYMFIYIYYGLVPSGFTSIIISLWFLGGLTIFSIGIVALYLAVIFIEVKSRPPAIVRAVYGHHPVEGAEPQLSEGDFTLSKGTEI